jgi:hypothetical protein
LPVGSPDQAPSGRLRSKALKDSGCSEWVEITHPFHPFHGRQFKVLKTRKIQGKDTFILQDSLSGTFAILREWTDKHSEYLQPAASILLIQKLLELIELRDKITSPQKKD